MSGTQPRKVKGQGQKCSQMHPPPSTHPLAPGPTAESSLCLWSIFIESQGTLKLSAEDECRLEFRHHVSDVSAIGVMPSVWPPDQILHGDLRARGAEGEARQRPSATLTAALLNSSRRQSPKQEKASDLKSVSARKQGQHIIS